MKPIEKKALNQQKKGNRTNHPRRKPDENKRTERITVKLTPSEAEALRSKAKAAGLKLSAFIRCNLGF